MRIQNPFVQFSKGESPLPIPAIAQELLKPGLKAEARRVESSQVAESPFRFSTVNNNRKMSFKQRRKTECRILTVPNQRVTQNNIIISQN